MNNHKHLSPENLLEIFSVSPVAIAVYTTEYLVIETATDMMLAFWNKNNTVIGQPIAEAMPELEGLHFLTELRSVWLTGQTVSQKNVPVELIVEGELQIRHFDYQYEALRKPEGKIYAVLHTAQDVTDRVLDIATSQSLANEQSLNEQLAAANQELNAINQELDRSQQSLHELNGKLETRAEERTLAAENAAYRMEAMVMNTPIAMTILRGEDLVVEIANQPMLNVWRRTEEQVIGKGLVEIFPELQNQPNPGRMRGVMKSGIRFTLPETEVILGTVDGELNKHYASFSYDPIFERDGTVQSILVTVINITDEVTTRQQLELSQQELIAVTQDLAEVNLRLNMAMEASSLGMAEAVFATGEMSSTEQFKRNFGRPVDQDFTYLQLFEAMLPEYRDEIRQRVKLAVDNHTIYEAEYEILWPDGSRHWISAHGIPRYQNGIADRIVGVCRLVTQQKNIEQQKDDFLSVASHELKTPITVLKGNLQLMERIKENPSHPLLPKLIESANKGIEKINVLIDDLLDINRFSQSKLKLDRSEFNVLNMLKNCIESISTEKRHAINFEGDSAMMMVADEHRIEQVVVNFVNNAFKYAPDSEVMLICFKRVNTSIRISVTDNGPGISPEQLPHLFDRYWRANHAGKKYTGLGLGLFICTEIIERHGGTIGADSIVGEGSTFWFEIPFSS